MVITGEGKIDRQTLQGKVVHGVANASRSANIPVVAICGLNVLEAHELERIGIRDVESVKTDQLSVEYCMKNASKLTQERAAELIRRNGRKL
ncbi:MAG: glycerate kinase [Cyclobacteriaceae bacterium]